MSSTTYRGQHRPARKDRAGAAWLVLAGLLTAASAVLGLNAGPSTATPPVPAPTLESTPAPLTPRQAASVTSGDVVIAPPHRAPRSGEMAVRANHLYIPSRGITAGVDPATLDARRYMRIPPPQRVGLLRQAGSCDLVAGHVDYEGVPGALKPLHTVRPGDLVVTTGPANVPVKWRVTSVAERAKARLTVPSSSPCLVIVTCAGVVRDGSYVDNLVVRAVPQRTRDMKD